MAAASDIVPDVPGPDHRAETPNRVISSPTARKAAYLAVPAIVAVLVVLGLITEEQVAQWAAVTISILTIGTNLLAAANTPKE